MESCQGEHPATQPASKHVASRGVRELFVRHTQLPCLVQHGSGVGRGACESECAGECGARGEKEGDGGGGVGAGAEVEDEGGGEVGCAMPSAAPASTPTSGRGTRPARATEPGSLCVDPWADGRLGDGATGSAAAQRTCVGAKRAGKAAAVTAGAAAAVTAALSATVGLSRCMRAGVGRGAWGMGVEV